MNRIPDWPNPFQQQSPFVTPGPSQAFDSDLRGYRIGDRLAVPPLSGIGSVPFVQAPLMGLPAHISRWKLQLAASVAVGSAAPANAGIGLRFFVIGAAGNERITRRCFIRAGDPANNDVTIENAQTLYVFGRTIDVKIQNPSNVAMVAQWGMDEATAGFSYWSDFEEITTGAGEVELDLPAFTSSFEFLTLPTSSAPVIRGYNGLGTEVYREILSVPRSTRLSVFPGLRYTVASSAGNSTYNIAYYCLG